MPFTSHSSVSMPGEGPLRRCRLSVQGQHLARARCLSVCTVVVFPQSEDGWDRQLDEAAALRLGLALPSTGVEREFYLRWTRSRAMS